MKKISSFLLIFLLFSCKKVDDLGYRTYIIKENHHRSTYSYRTSRSDLIQFKAIFDSSAIYLTQDSLNQYDVNKLYGVSDCSKGHMKYSIRFGWRWLHGNLEILWFKHQHGEFTFNKITNAIINQPQNYSIEIQEDQYILCVDGTCDSTERTCPQNYKRYYLYPYFGGQEAAPHTIKIKIK